MIKYLRETPLPLPIVTKSGEASVSKRTGTVSPSFDRGDLFLENARGAVYRLSWTGDESPEASARVIPAGNYKLKTYRIVQEREGELWHISATKASIKEVKVKAGGHTTVVVDDAVTMGSVLHGNRAQMTIQGERGAGLSIYRAGRRIPIGFQVVGRSGEVLSKGKMRYG